MEPMHWYALALVGAALGIGIEEWIARRRGMRVQGLRQTVNSASHLLGEMVLTSVLYLNVFLGYAWLEAKIGIFAPDASSWITWVVAFLALDFVYYLGHRACHRVGVLWALHEVHHQSTELNLAAGIRGPWLSAFQIAPFMVPLALAGLPPEVLFPVYAVHTAWKLLVHTRLVGRLGWLEQVLITPSAHRVHHGHNAHFVDRNFGGALAIWDRLFGTFQVEDEEPDFGRAAPAADPLHNNVQPWVQLIRRARSARGLLGTVRVLFGPPVAEDVAVATAPVRTETPVRAGKVLVLAARLAAATGATALLLVADLPLLLRAILGVAVIALVVSANSGLRVSSPAR